jgi:hypothetical protein
LLEAALAAFDQCTGAAAQTKGTVSESASDARTALRRTLKPRYYREAVDVNIDLATALWSERGKLCGALGPEYEALARAVTDVAR